MTVMLIKHQQAEGRISSESLSNLPISQSEIICFPLLFSAIAERSEDSERNIYEELHAYRFQICIAFMHTDMVILYIIFIVLLCKMSFTPSFVSKQAKKPQMVK